MNILHVNEFWAPGGVETVIRNLVADAWYNPQVYVFNSNYAFPPPDCPFTVNNVMIPDRLTQWADIIHFHSPWHIGDYTKKNKVVVTSHNISLPKGFDSRLLKDIDRVVTVSEASVNAIRRVVDEDFRLDVIPSGVDTKKIQQARGARVGWADLLSMPDYGSIFLWVGRIGSHAKNFGLLLEIVQNTNFHFVVIGDEYLAGYEPGLSPQEVSLFNSLKTDGRISHMPYLSSGDLYSLYKSVDGVISTSRYEGFGLVIAEAMAAGQLVIVPDTPALNELVTTDSGILFRSDPCAHSWEGTFDLPEEEKNRRRANAQKRAENWDIELVSDKYYKLYEEILCGS